MSSWVGRLGIDAWMSRAVGLAPQSILDTCSYTHTPPHPHSTSSAYPGGAGGGPPWGGQGQPPQHSQHQRVPRGFGLGGDDDDGSDDDFSSSGPLANDPWRRFRKTSRERCVRE